MCACFCSQGARVGQHALRQLPAAACVSAAPHGCPRHPPTHTRRPHPTLNEPPAAPPAPAGAPGSRRPPRCCRCSWAGACGSSPPAMHAWVGCGGCCGGADGSERVTGGRRVLHTTSCRAYQRTGLHRRTCAPRTSHAFVHQAPRPPPPPSLPVTGWVPALVVTLGLAVMTAYSGSLFQRLYQAVPSAVLFGDVGRQAAGARGRRIVYGARARSVICGVCVCVCLGGGGGVVRSWRCAASFLPGCGAFEGRCTTTTPGVSETCCPARHRTLQASSTRWTPRAA
jgi:hypothetical protein